MGTTTVISYGAEFKVLARNELSSATGNEKCGASPAISQQNIFIRSAKHLYCIGNK